MLTASIVPATVKSISLSSISSAVGLIINSPLTLPTFTPATGPLNGISLIDTASDEANKAVISGVLSWSTDNISFTTSTLFLKFSGNNGLIGLSIILAHNVAASVGLPSLFINPPGILPTAYCFSIYTTVSGKKSDNISHSFDTVVAANVTVSPYLTRTAPAACLANSPFSTTIFLPLKSNSNIFLSITTSFQK